jgi:hypothetical protein
MTLRPGVRAIGFAALLLAGGCLGNTDPVDEVFQDALRLWRGANVRDYSMVLTRRGRVDVPVVVRLTVRGGVVTDRTNLGTNQPVLAADASKYPDVDGLFEILEDAFNRAAAFDASYDRIYGYPVVMAIEYDLSNPSLYLSITVTDFTLLPAAAPARP